MSNSFEKEIQKYNTLLREMRYHKKLFSRIVSRQSNSFLPAKYTSGKEEKADYSVAWHPCLLGRQNLARSCDSRLRTHVDGVKRVPRLLFLRKHIRHRSIGNSVISAFLDFTAFADQRFLIRWKSNTRIK